MSEESLTICAIFRVPAAGRAAFDAYETAVLTLLADYGGMLERRLLTPDGATEIHLIRFPSDTAFDAYRADARREALSWVFVESGATAEVLTVRDAIVRPDGA